MIRLLALLALTGAANAETSLQGRTVTFSVLTYDDPAKPLFVGQGETVVVGDGVEFGLLAEGSQNGLDVQPVLVDIGPSRIEVAYSLTPRGQLFRAAFNGYVLRFETECALFADAAIDRAFTNIALADDAVSVKGGTLMINVAALSYTPESRFAIDLGVADCPLS